PEEPEFPRKLGNGSNTYLLTDITRTHYDVASKVPQWSKLSNIVATGNTLINTGVGGWLDRAFSTNSIPANEDGYIEFKAGTEGGDFAVGFASSYQEGGIYTINHGLLLQGGNVYLLENSYASTVVTTYTLTDLIRVERVGTTIFYKKNGFVVYTSSLPSTGALFGSVYMNNVGGIINEMAMEIAHQNTRNRVAWVEVLDKTDITVYENDGTNLTAVPNSPSGGVSPSLVTLNGQSYIKVENVCHCEGATQMFGGPIRVTPGERYLLRVKGYAVADNAPEFFAYFANEDGTTALTPNRGEFHLPMGAQAENWVEQTVDVPEGVTFLYSWISWRWPATGDFYVNQIELIKKEADANNRIVTQYSYDTHGNVKSLLQVIPALAPKRTDYVYDLVSGKVNFVMYQYGESDQFIHRYEYDADNRITAAKTSSDGFIWDNDASYQYYLHGPLARTLLGEHKVQGLDYYYTLQGWLKGVNSPTGISAQANDPGADGNGTSKFAKDVMAFNLGYYQGDYKPIGAGRSAMLIENSSATDLNALWRGAAGEALDLFNGNIAWMATDL
ncbi:MAG: hypothetical protein ACKO96_46005, partial [Flammeovirgaceae bacterium]